MTSPAITKSPDNQKAAEKKSPTHSARVPSRAGSPAPAAPASASASAAHCPMPLGWLRVFKMSDLMMKQGC